MSEEVRMRKMKRYTTPALIACLLILSIGGTMAAVSCQPELPKLPINYPPAYFIDIQFPPEEEPREEGLFYLTLERGSSLTLPVTVTSESNVPIRIRLALSDNPAIPEFITFQTQQEYVTLEPEESIDMTVTFTIAESATLGSYRMSVWGELEEPVEERSTMGQAFTLVITASQV
jgi:hypothetical protein